MCFLIGVGLTYSCLNQPIENKNKIIENYRLEQAKRDTLILIRDEIINKINKEKEDIEKEVVSVKKERDYYKKKVEANVKLIKELSVISVKPEDYKDLEKWILKYNSSLK